MERPLLLALYEVERSWRDTKHVLDLRPVYHRREERIRSHVLLCLLGCLPGWPRPRWATLGPGSVGSSSGCNSGIGSAQ
jgi:hypothetical protein